MSKPIILSHRDWAVIHQRLVRDYPTSVLLLRRKMRDTLGFTLRYHQVWVQDSDDGVNYYEDEVHLDFYNESKRTFFLLKYHNFE